MIRVSTSFRVVLRSGGAAITALLHLPTPAIAGSRGLNAGVISESKTTASLSGPDGYTVAVLFSDVGGRCLPFVMKGLCGEDVMSGPNSPQRRLSISYHCGPFCLRWSMPMVEWLVVVHSDASSSCPIVRTEASDMVVGQMQTGHLSGSLWGAAFVGQPFARAGAEKKRSRCAKMRVTIPRAHKLAPRRRSLGAADRLVKRRP